jgi:glutamate-1-semialdehyde 2,1-aminomutase
LHALGDRLRSGIAEQARRIGAPVQVPGDGPVLQVFFTDQPIRTWRDCLRADSKRAVRFGYELIRRQVYCAPGGKMYVSLAHSDADIEITLTRAGDALREACRG